jgi:hypothetical protein
MLMFRAAALLAIAASAAVAATAEHHGIDLAGIDHGVKPGDDFFGYANGAWLKSHEIPADRASYGPGSILIEKTREQVKVLIQDAAKANPQHGSDAQKVGDYYASYLDQAAIDKKGLDPLKADMAKISGLKDKTALSSYLGSTLRADVDALNSTNFYTDHIFGVWITQGFEDPSHNVPYVLQGGLGMPDREYYLDQSAPMAKLRDAYKKHIVNVLKLAGIADADKKAAAIFDLETKIAKTHATREASEDVHTANNPWKRADFAAKAPGLDWNAYWSAATLGNQNDFIVWHPGAVKGISALSHRPSHRSSRGRAAAHLRRRALRLLRHGAVGRAQAARTLEARHRRDQCAAGRGRGQALCRQAFPAVVQGAHPGDGERPDRRLSRAHLRARLDVAEDEREGAGQALHALCRRRLPRDLARLFRVRRGARRCTGQRRPRRDVRIQAQPRQADVLGRP